jgi:hypothetical protein
MRPGLASGVTKQVGNFMIYVPLEKMPTLVVVKTVI